MSYNYIRLTKELTVTPTAFQGISLIDGRTHIWLAWQNGPVTIWDADEAAAITAFVEGTIAYPVNANGVLDIPQGWANSRNAQVTLGGDSNWYGGPALDPTIKPDAGVSTTIYSPMTTITSLPPSNESQPSSVTSLRPSLDKIEERLRAARGE